MSADWMSFLPHTWDADLREPSWTFEIGGETYNLFLPSLTFWVSLLTFQVVQALFAAAVSTVVYKFIIKRQGSPSSYLMAYGVVIPTILLFPSYMIRSAGIRNQLFRFACGNRMPVLSILRTSAAAHGYSPKHVTKSMKSYALYFGCPMAIKYDSKRDQYVKISIVEQLKLLRSIFLYVIYGGCMQSLFLRYPEVFPVFGSHRDYSSWYSWRVFLGLGDMQIFLHSLVLLVFFKSFMTAFGDGMKLAQQFFTGYETEPLMLNPAASTSPSDFWSRRWNVLIHDSLKRGVFKPVRKFTSKYVAMAASFFVSGLVHEYVLTVVFPFSEYKYSDDGTCIGDQPRDCFVPPYGFAMMFFAWHALFIASEMTIGQLPIFKKIPLGLRPFFVFSIGTLPGYWFTAPYIDSDFFGNGKPGFFSISRQAWTM